MEAIPKYFLLDRRLIGALDTAKKVVESTAVASVLSDHPWVAALLIALRIGLSSVVAAAVARNPINISATQTIDAVGTAEPAPTTTT